MSIVSGVVVWKKDDGNQLAVVCGDHDAVVIVVVLVWVRVVFGNAVYDDSEAQVTRLNT